MEAQLAPKRVHSLLGVFFDERKRCGLQEKGRERQIALCQQIDFATREKPEKPQVLIDYPEHEKVVNNTLYHFFPVFFQDGSFSHFYGVPVKAKTENAATN